MKQDLSIPALMSNFDYRSLTHKVADKILRQYWYHNEIKNEIKRALNVALTDPQEAYESIILFTICDLQKILSKRSDQLELMFEYIEKLFPEHAFEMKTKYHELIDEYEEILRARAIALHNKESVRGFAAELDEFYHNRMIRLFN